MLGKKIFLLAEKNTTIAVAIILEILLKILNISGNNILTKILYLVFSIGPCDKAYLGTACDLRAAGDMSVDPHTDLETTSTSSCTSSFNFDQVFIKAPGLLGFTVRVYGKG